MSYFRSQEKKWEIFPEIKLKCLVKPSTLGQWIDVISFDFGNSGLYYIFYRSITNISSTPLNNVNADIRLVDPNGKQIVKFNPTPLVAGTINLTQVGQPVSDAIYYVPKDSRIQFRFLNEVPTDGSIWLMLLYETSSADFALRVI